MRAWLLDETGGSLRKGELPVPRPGPGQVLLRVEASGVCHSDLHIIRGDWEGLRRVLKKPVVPGREVVGKVVEAGAGVDLALGRRLGVPWLHWSCGACPPCSDGLENLCDRQQITGVTVDGGWAEFVLAQATHAALLPEDADPASLSPLLCAGLTVYRAIKLARPKPGSVSAVFGIGGLGHLAVQLLKRAGTFVIAVDALPAKLELARSLGADEAFLAEDLPRAMKGIGGFDTALVAAASAEAYAAAFRGLRRGGALAVLGLPSEDIALSPFRMVSLEARIVSAAVGTRADLAELLAMASELRCVVEKLPFQAAPEALARLARGEVRGRAVLIPTGEFGSASFVSGRAATS